MWCCIQFVIGIFNALYVALHVHVYCMDVCKLIRTPSTHMYIESRYNGDLLSDHGTVIMCMHVCLFLSLLDI